MRRLSLFGIITLFFALAGCSAETEGEIKDVINVVKNISDTFPDETKEKSDVTSSEDSQQEVTYTVGQIFTVKNVEFAVNSISLRTTIGDWSEKTAQGIYLILNISTKNIGKDPISVSESDFTLYLGDIEYAPDLSAGSYIGGDGEFYADINPGNGFTGNVVFDIPQNVANNSELQLKIQRGFWDSESAIVNINK